MDQVHTVNAQTQSPLPFADMKKTVTSIATLGARLFSPKEHSAQVGWAIRKGNDFPDETMGQLEDWGATLTIIQEDTSLSTRCQLNYLDSTFASTASKSARLERRASDYIPTVQPNPPNT